MLLIQLPDKTTKEGPRYSKPGRIGFGSFSLKVLHQWLKREPTKQRAYDERSSPRLPTRVPTHWLADIEMELSYRIKEFIGKQERSERKAGNCQTSCLFWRRSNFHLSSIFFCFILFPLCPCLWVSRIEQMQKLRRILGILLMSAPSSLSGYSSFPSSLTLF